MLLWHEHKIRLRLYLSFLLRALMKASLGTSTLPMSLIFFLPSACFFRSFIFRVISPPYCQHRHHLWCVVHMYNIIHQLKKIVLTHFARTFFLYALILKEENTELLHLYTFRHQYNSCNHGWMHACIPLLHTLFCMIEKHLTFIKTLNVKNNYVSLAIILLPMAACTAISNICLGMTSLSRSHMDFPVL